MFKKHREDDRVERTFPPDAYEQKPSLPKEKASEFSENYEKPAELSYDLDAPRLAGVVMFDVTDHRALPYLEFNGKKWYPSAAHADTHSVILTSSAARIGTRPSAQQRLNKEQEAADKLRRQQLRDKITRSQEASVAAEAAGNVSAVGELFIERKHLQADLDKSLAIQSVHADRVIVRDLLVLNLGTNFFPGDPSRLPLRGLRGTHLAVPY